MLNHGQRIKKKPPLPPIIQIVDGTDHTSEFYTVLSKKKDKITNMNIEIAEQMYIFLRNWFILMMYPIIQFADEHTYTTNLHMKNPKLTNACNFSGPKNLNS